MLDALTSPQFPRSELEQSIPDRFARQVRRYPQRIAVSDKTGELTYEELDQHTNRIAHAILARHESPSNPVAFLMEQGIPSVLAILSIVKAGDFYVPLDPTYPYDRIAYMLADSTARVIVTNRSHVALAQQLASDQCHIVNIDDLSPSDSCRNVDLIIPHESLVYIMYTSGSTGLPKGVMDTHRNVLHQTMRYTEQLDICCDDRLTNLRSSSFNGAVKDVFGAVLNGATVMSFDLKKGGIGNVSDWLIQTGITIYCSVGTVYRQLASSLTGKGLFPELRVIYTGGEPIYRSDVELFQTHFSSSCVFMVSLGTTETGGSVRRFVIDAHTPFNGNVVPIGYDVSDMEILLLDDNGVSQVNGDNGEIAVRSEFLSPGYWRRPDLTARVFLPDPEGGDKRIFRTGDLGCMLPDGCLIHLGRKDAQVKVRGQRVEVGEVEAALLNLHDVKDAAVIALDDSDRGTRLAAYFVPSSHPGPTVTELRRLLSRTLPDYMVPSAYVKLEALPHTPGGKVDRKNLPEPGRRRPELDTPYIEPRTPLEEKLAEVWSQILCIEPVGINDSFLDLGGHSLMAGRIASRIVDAFHVLLPLRALFEASTVAEMALKITEAQAQETGLEETQRILGALDG